MVARVAAKRLAILFAAAGAMLGQVVQDDARDIIRKSVELDQANWQRMKDYTWIARQTDRSLDSSGEVKAEKSETWETVVVYGEPHHRMLERNGKPLSAEDQRKEQEELDKAVAKRERESPEQRQRREAQYEKGREKDREFLREVPDLFDFQMLGDQKIDGHDVWVISATPKPDARPKVAMPMRCSKLEPRSGWIRGNTSGCALKRKPRLRFRLGCLSRA